jgi:UDP-N-acetylglucosamine 2-epimerase
VDALQHIANTQYDWSTGPLANVPKTGEVVLITAHRRESFGTTLREMCLGIRDLANRFIADNVSFVFPVHPNPNVRRSVEDILSDVRNVILLEPLDYSAMVHLMMRAVIVLTDSGGIQEEAPSFGVPVLVMRDKTERPEGIEAGVARLIGRKRNQIVEEASLLLREPSARAAMSSDINPYGDGKASTRIVAALLSAECP